MASPELIERVFAMMVATYPPAPKTAEESAMLLEAWRMALNDVPDQMLQVGASAYLKSGATWRPNPGQLVEQASRVEEHAHWSAVAERSMSAGLLPQLTARNYTQAEIDAHVAKLHNDYIEKARRDPLYRAGLIDLQEQARLENDALFAAPAPLAALTAGR